MIIPLMTACGFIIPSETDVSKNALKGHVLTLKENSYKAIEKFGKVQEGERARKSMLGFDYTKKFNKAGAMVEYCEFESNLGTLVYKNSMVYNGNNQATQQRSYSANEKLNLKSSYTYNDHGNVIEIAVYTANDKLSARYTYKCDADGQVLAEAGYRADGSLNWKKKYEYNRRGQVIEMFRDDSDNHFDRTYIYIYNNKHQLKEEILKDADHIFDKRYVYTYDKKGRRILEESYNSSAKLYSRLQYRYDGRGNKTEMNEMYAGEKSIGRYSYTYDYDRKGNWIRRIEYYNDIPKYIVTRDIVYHRGLGRRLLVALGLNNSQDKISGNEGIEEGL